MESRTRRSWAALSACLFALLWFTAPLSLASPNGQATAISASAELSKTYSLTLNGSLTAADGTPVPQAQIVVRAEDQTLGYVTTDAAGKFSAATTLPANLQRNSLTLEFSFAGQGTFKASNLRGSVSLDAPAAANSQQPNQPATPAAKQAVTLKATADKTKVSAGSLMQLTGSLTTAAGAAIGNAQLDFLLNDTIQPDSTTFTTADGKFSAYFQVPDAQPAGSAQLKVSFPGSESLAAGSVDLKLTVSVDSPAPKPAATQPVERAAVTPTSVAAPQKPANATPAADATAAASDKPATPANISGPSPMSWFWAAIVVVGGSAILVTAALIFRGLRTSATPPDGDGLSLIREQEFDAETVAEDSVPMRASSAPDI